MLRVGAAGLATFHIRVPIDDENTWHVWYQTFDYTPTEPLLVVEVDADVCFEHDRWRHPTGFRSVRLDLLADEIAGSSAP